MGGGRVGLGCEGTLFNGDFKTLMNPPKTVEALKKSALISWPQELVEKEKKKSVIPLLVETQENFISLLKVADATHEAWIEAIELSRVLYPNLFLKHLCIISDVGGESLKRYSTELPKLFQNTPFQYKFLGELYTHPMQSLSEKKQWSNVNLGLDERGIHQKKRMDRSIRDASTLILFGSLSVTKGLPIEIQEKCVLGGMLGKDEELERYVRQRYIYVSRQTQGARSNTMGHLMQNYLLDFLKKRLPEWSFSNNNIDGMGFDIVAQSPLGLCWAIESSFQFTTNSTIERKAGQAVSRKRLLKDKGHCIAYVIDGAGNFERRSAIQRIMEASDCTVNFSEKDLLRLVETMKDSIKKIL